MDSLSELSAAEVVVLVQLLKTCDDDAMTFNDKNELTFIRDLPECQSLIEKISKAGDREDVKELIERKYGSE